MEILYQSSSEYYYTKEVTTVQLSEKHTKILVLPKHWLYRITPLSTRRHDAEQKFY